MMIENKKWNNRFLHNFWNWLWMNKFKHAPQDKTMDLVRQIDYALILKTFLNDKKRNIFFNDFVFFNM